MPGELIEAVFENGVFRPLHPVHLPEHQRVTLELPATGGDENGSPGEEEEEEVGYQPLPLGECKTIRVRLKRIGELPPVPYPIESTGQEEE